MNYQKQLEYYQYVERQRSNYIDLTVEQNDSIKSLARHIFSKATRNLNRDLTGVLLDESMDIADLYCALLELMLYGLDMLAGVKLFDLMNVYDDIVFTLRDYFKTMGFDVVMDEVAEVGEDGYCVIVDNLLNDRGWIVLDYYWMKVNQLFVFDRATPLEKFKAYVVTREGKVFVVSFKFVDLK